MSDPGDTDSRVSVRARVNGREVEAEVEPRLLLSDFLRHDLDLTGTHVGCEHGVCGACTVLVDGAPVRSCLMLAVQVRGSTIRTVEDLTGDDGSLHPLQEAFRETHALQCGFCTPGFLMSLVEFLDDHPDPGEQQIREALAGNLCRCTGYQHIVDAVARAAAKMRGDDGSANDGGSPSDGDPPADDDSPFGVEFRGGSSAP